MYILSKDEKVLVNCDNIASISINKKYMQYHHPDTWWEITAMYPAVSSDVLCDVLGKFDTEEECKKVFKSLCFYMRNEQYLKDNGGIIRMKDVCS